MIRLISILVFATAIAPASAQVKNGGDSLYRSVISRNNIAFINSNSTQLEAGDVNKAGMASLSFNTANGSYRRSQEAQQSTTANFYTEGISTIGRFKVAGSFRFNKIWEDSLAWSMKGIDEDVQPYYFFAGKAGAYERQNYNLKAIVSYTLLKDRLFLASGFKYDYHWTTRSVDPRPDVKLFSIQVSPSLTYKAGDHVIGAGITWGYGNETNSITYKNKNYAGNQLYIDRNSYLSLGYGHIAKMQGSLRRYDKFSGFDLNYAGTVAGINTKASFSYLLREEDNTRDAGSSQTYSLFSYLQLEDYKAALLLTDKTGRRQLQFSFLSGSALNWAAEFNATSYQYVSNHADATYLQRFGKRVTHEAGFSLAYDDVSKDDMVEEHSIAYQLLQPGLQYNIYWNNKERDQFSAGFSPSVKLPLNNQIHVPATQENVFTKGIVYPDYIYRDSKVLQLDAEIAASTHRLVRNLHMGLKIKASWQSAEAAVIAFPQAGFIPGRNRFLLNVSANLYF
ncbi:DUF6850 family outer membrane beta-barrel protein [Sediminibacterium ginsengisoli]|uniref:DUF6850 domain-containing protein n=1 Tax=Sediminibacterium ginsengisoli TaxID=413434 RepID=A0A1T4KBP4_9BACT|nr:DUF6850 family outer membrane beta-barrel protein [Sediminibacterium ginsengisoli]SJZ39860.1 hypothetical protein SAMN04488132_101600 [Sediminibacterium ginsengisoli]